MAIKLTNAPLESLSFSAVETYITCPLQYKYRHVLKLPSLPSSALSFGTTIHDSLRDFHTKLMFNKEITMEELMTSYENNWQPLGYLNEEHRKIRFENGKELLERYYALSYKSGGVEVYILNK